MNAITYAVLTVLKWILDFSCWLRRKRQRVVRDFFPD